MITNKNLLVGIYNCVPLGFLAEINHIKYYKNLVVLDISQFIHIAILK